MWYRPPNSQRDYLEAVFNNMKEGQEIQIDAWMFEEAYRFGMGNSRQNFLSGRVGSGWGTYTCERRHSTNPRKHGDYYLIGRHKESNKRVYVDPDREWMYRFNPITQTYELPNS